jgi:hypothetical protein
MNSLGSWVNVVLIAASAVVTSAGAADPNAEKSPENGSKSQRPSAAEVVQQFMANRSFPIKADELSQVDSIQGVGDVFIYNYSLIKPLDAAAQHALSAALKAGSVANACESVNFMTLFKQGYSVSLNYVFSDAKDDVHIVVKPDDCRVNSPRNSN